MGRDELIELVRMYPDFLVQALDGYLRESAAGRDHRHALEDLEVRVRLAQGFVEVGLDDLPFVREAILAAEPTTEEPTLASAR